MTEVEATGKNVEQAIENALFELRVPREDVDIKILDQGGFFKKAKVHVSISEDAMPKYEKIKNLVKQEQKSVVSADNDGVVISKKPLPIEEKVETVTKEIKQEQSVNESKTTEKTKAENAISELETGKAFLEGILSQFDIEGEVIAEEKGNEIFYTINGKNVGELIGYRGDNLNAIQYLTSIVNGKNNRHTKLVRLDIDGFKERRKQTLEALAHRIAKKVEKTGHSTKLEPMQAYERRIIHTVIQDYETLQSYSEGEEPNRYLVVAPKI